MTTVLAVLVLVVSVAAPQAAAASSASPARRLTFAGPHRVGTLVPGDVVVASCPDAGFCLAVDAERSVLRYDGLRWTRALRAIPFVPNALSCTSATFCLAVSDDAALRWTGASWALAGNLWGRSLSCVSPRFCVAVNGVQYFVWTGSSWSASENLPYPTTDAVSCVSVRSCEVSIAATDDSGRTTFATGRFDGTRWLPLHVLATRTDGTSAESLVSCRGSFCLYFTSGFTGTYDLFSASATFRAGVGWSNLQPAPVPDSQSFQDFPTGLACASPTLCVAAWQQTHTAATFDGAGWTTAAPAAGTANEPVANPVASCPSTSACVLFDGAAAAARTSPRWHDAFTVDRDASDGFRHISCVGASFCAAADDLDVRTGHGTTWSAPTRIAAGPPADDVYGSDVSDVSCASPNFCLATTVGTEDQLTPTSGWALWDGSTWSVHDPDTDTFSGFGLRSVSCVSPTSCIAVADFQDYSSDTAYIAFRYDGSGWSQIATFDRYVDRVSCTSTTFCLATGSGAWTRFDGVDWTPLTPFDSSTVTGLSCAGPRSCMAVDDAGRALHYGPAGWGTAVPVADDALTAVSCRTAAACLAVGPDAGVHQWLGGRHWRATAVRLSTPTGVSCPTSHVCTVTDDHGLAATGTARQRRCRPPGRCGTPPVTALDASYAR